MQISENSDGHKQEIEKVIAAVRSGEQSELGRLLEIYSGYLLTIARESLAPDVAVKVAPSDLVQEALLQATSGFAEFRGSTEPELRAWLRQILTRELQDVHRHYRDFAKRDISREIRLDDSSLGNFNESELAADTKPPSVLVRKAEAIRMVQDALNLLAEDHRLAIQLRNFEQLSFEEMGKRLQRSEEAARKLWWRAIEKLTQELERHDSEPS